MKKKPGLKDIAQEAGVSTALVSYVLNNKKEGRINKDLAQKIKQIARSLNYRTNQIARSLKTNRTHTIGLIVADISNNFSSSLARIIEDEADHHGYTVLFGSSDENDAKFERILDTLVTRQVDGLIMAPPENTENQVRILQQQQVPFVLFDRYYPGFQCNYVALDNFGAVYKGVTHLINKNRKKIGLITYRSSLFHLQERVRGYVEALNDNGIGFNPERLKEVDIIYRKTEIETAIDDLLFHKDPVDAIIFGSNSIALNGLKHILKRNISVPDALEIVSFDETDAQDLFNASMTFLRQPMLEMGQTATRILLDQMNKSKTPQEIILQAEMIHVER
ncbi:LacI family DNA-binding transcriptional regulator [Pollutibacter soli]|uniref:LacI family DNA-binding transcriptional regulator n=1 Tax=Pollutibacter soli TaxID=3034157 RepID=UPI0030141D2B